jgi:ABC-type Zn uptake system ZnuABC Zn-binding protein ZnuA
MRHARLGLLAALAAATIAGCGSSGSSNEIQLGKTSDVSFGVSIEATDDVAAKVSARFYILGAGGGRSPQGTSC